MILKNLNIVNYKNIAEASVTCSPRFNCFIGNNGVGKTNILDAVYQLSMCKSYFNLPDAQNIRHGEAFFVIEGQYDYGEEEIDVYCGVKRGQKKIFKKSDLELFMRDRGSKIDLLNIQWIYRAKKYYNMKPADIYLMLIPIHYKLSTELVKDMVEAPGVEEFENVVIRTTYARHYNFKQNLTMEQMYADCLHHLYTADRRKNPYSVSAINTYLFLKEEELKKLTTVMECVRYGLNPGETAAYIGGRTR